MYDPFSPWQVLNIQCYPDYKSRMDVHDSSKHYINGVEAFMTTLLGEYRDAKRRFEDITEKISRRVRPPLEFMFSSEIRDGLLFEDENYSMSRRYFWAHQTLGIMNESIKALVDAYEDEFTDDVWEGRNKIVWPLLDEHSPRNNNYKRKMAGLKKEFEAVIRSMKGLIAENNERRREINGLREDLFTGTSIQESRKSVVRFPPFANLKHEYELIPPRVGGHFNYHSTGPQHQTAHSCLDLLPAPNFRHFRLRYDKHAQRKTLHDLRHCDSDRLYSVLRPDRLP